VHAIASGRRGSRFVVDCDVHCALPKGALLPYLPTQWAELGRMGGGEFGQSAGIATAYPPWHPHFRTPAEISLDDLRDGPLAVADQAILNCYSGVEAFTHPYLAPELATAVNRWLEDEWLQREERLLASIVVTPQFPDAAVEEIKRAAQNPRFVQVLLPVRSWGSFGAKEFWPVLEAAVEHELPVAMSYGGVSGLPPTPVNWMASFFETYATAVLPFEANVADLVMGGIFSRLPDLRIVVMESGWTWVPSMLWRIDSHWKALQREVPWVDEPPSRLVRRHFRFTIQPTDILDVTMLRHALEQLNTPEMDAAELFLYASDYPHQHGGGADLLLDELDGDRLESVMAGNARAWYRVGDEVAAPSP